MAMAITGWERAQVQRLLAALGTVSDWELYAQVRDLARVHKRKQPEPNEIRLIVSELEDAEFCTQVGDIMDGGTEHVYSVIPQQDWAQWGQEQRWEWAAGKMVEWRRFRVLRRKQADRQEKDR